MKILDVELSGGGDNRSRGLKPTLLRSGYHAHITSPPHPHMND